nr:methyltransferase domain-containing protein [Rikenellaceae bacterium]
MITHEEFDILCRDEVRTAIRNNCRRNPTEIALDRRVPEARLVATQVKYLQRALGKLPTYYEAGCILPPRAFEQASSEQCAAHKAIEGERVLDLTCGLGVDALFLSRRFRQVVALERNEVLANITRENFRRMGITNIEVVTTSAEAYVAACTDHFDWVYADPDRRSAEGKKLVRLEDCSPDVLALLPQLKRLSPHLCLKNSPLFDVDEALRLFPTCRVEVVSLNGECKEVVLYDDGTGPSITATAIGLGSVTHAEHPIVPPPADFSSTPYRWLIIPDVALQKGRIVRAHLAGKGDCWSENGYGFAVERPEEVLGRTLEIEAIEPFDPKALKRSLKGQRVELLKRDFPLALEELRRRLGVREGCEQRLAFTKIGPDYWTIRLK